ncbi:HAD-IIIC family phosphatase [Anabaena lutea]|uniref:HAD-IIIC family phosphatase n=1 Tax=Anabaena lutea FACHB-196 TaxID=2692881 RepID=A0ABR8FBM0_9NOST|nr:HAD-IIIC family phosphatase [Anabaena lutea]MBD2567496.1 HAD-IIIC family phosphatase [Anabaena lutea FACHB-196]
MKLIKILSVLIIETIKFLYPLFLVVIAALLDAWMISSIFPEPNTLVIVAIFPILYFFWLLTFISLSALLTKLLFLSVNKPRFSEINVLKDLLLLIKLSPVSISYKLMLLLDTLPLVNYFKLNPTGWKWLRNLVMQAYSPKVHIGKNSVVVTWPQDPDLTYIGNNVVIGSECHLVAHALNTSDGKVKYISEPITIGDRATIGGNSRIGMGVKIEEDAIVEVGSNVIPFTRIGRGEVWGGNPAVLLRKRNELADESKAKSSLQPIALLELNEIISNAIRLLPEEISDDLNSENCMAWDSLAKMSIAASLYDRFSVRIPAQDIFNLNSRQSIKQLINLHTDNKLPNSLETATALSKDPEIPINPELFPLYDPDQVTQVLARRFRESIAESDKKIIIAASFTAQPLGSTLYLWCRAFGIPFSVEFGEFNQLETTLLSPDSLFVNNINGLNVVLTRPEDLISDGDQEGFIRSSQLLDAIRSYVAKKKGLIVSNLPPAVSPFFYGKYQQVDKLRFWWQEKLEEIEGIHILDFAQVVEEIGRQNSQDASLEAIARAPYSQAVYQQLGITLTRLTHRILLPAKKVIALDCDGILWGGIVGEDGIDGIILSDDYPGRSFRLFQEMILDIKKRGILLVLVSKNEEADVWNVFDNHPEMLLRRSDIAAYRINWNAKSVNLRELSKELNVGLDSFVFVDDSPIECLEVEVNVPEVTVVRMPKQLENYVKHFSQLWCFDSCNITIEDKIRTELITQEQERRELQKSISNLESYLESLQLVVEIRTAQERDLPRVAQLTQKTNQFNLSLIRRSLPEIQDIYTSCFIMVLNLKDRFGDYGLVGAAIVKKNDEGLFIDTFLISCRALGRGVEQSFLVSIFDLAEQQGLKTIIAPYCSGQRNEQVKTFLLKMGFSQNQSSVLKAQVANAPEKLGYIKMQLRLPEFV